MSSVELFPVNVARLERICAGRLVQATAHFNVTGWVPFMRLETVTYLVLRRQSNPSAETFRWEAHKIAFPEGGFKTEAQALSAAFGKAELLAQCINEEARRD